MLSRNPTKLVGYRHLDFVEDIQIDEFTSSEESRVDPGNASKASRSRTTSKCQAMGSEGKTARWDPV